MGNRIVMIEDDAAIAQAVQLNLECAEYEVTVFDNGQTAWDALRDNHDYDLALLDMMLPGIDGFALLPKLREYGIPVICLTAMGDPGHEVQGLRGGAEDYIAKPFDMLALMVRMEKVLSRRGKLHEIYHFRDLTLDKGNRRLTRKGEEICLPPLEFDVLAVLMKNKNRTVSRERILNEIWGQDYFGDIRTVDVRVANLRKKLNLSEAIRTISKAGYRLEER
ncbi:response regulator transcription factor [Pseudoflavonifractor sp. MSJ-30]|uniref:response regulator transcription factor n=1 Tax=Pseudoflavonifractor sp. MSJ-30 TaxID=2841525 RepID=UPI001C10B4AE|nr:response regulator transcription factor [Pseudoflavonifractor sp. MSJ-30]MBU5453544.1 response regulator transcription factor [Pseudoflavonifractor sp. MSJ-30]